MHVQIAEAKLILSIACSGDLECKISKLAQSHKSMKSEAIKYAWLVRRWRFVKKTVKPSIKLVKPANNNIKLIISMSLNRL